MYFIGNGSDAGAASTLVKEHDSSNFIMNGTKSWMYVKILIPMKTKLKS